MKKAFLLLVLFLLTELGATANVSVSFSWYNIDTQSWEKRTQQLGSSNWSQNVKYQSTSNLPVISWDAGTKVLTVTNQAYFEQFNVETDKAGESVNMKVTNVSFGNLTVQCDVSFTPISGTAKVSAQQVEFLKYGKTCISALGADLTLYSVKGTSDKTSRFWLQYGGSLTIKNAGECSGIGSILWNEGIGFITPHGAYVSEGVIKTASGSRFLGEVKVGPVKSYGFFLGRTEVTEANYDLLDKPTRYFPDVDFGKLKYVPEEKTLYMENVRIEGDIINRDCANLRIVTKDRCRADELCVYSNTKLCRENWGSMRVDGVRIGGKTILYCFDDLYTGYIQGTSTTDDRQMSRLCIENIASNKCGSVFFEGTTKGGMMKDVRLVDIVDNDSRLALSTWRKVEDGKYTYISGLMYGKIPSGANAGHYGVYEKSTNTFFAPETVSANYLKLVGFQTVFPLKVGGVWVTDANYYFIESPNITYASDGEFYSTMSFDPSVGTLYIDGANIKASAGIPAIEYTGNFDLRIYVGKNDFLKDQNLVPETKKKVGSGKLTSTITCSDETPAIVSSVNTIIGYGQLTVNSQNSSSMKCGAFNIVGDMSFDRLADVSVPVVSANQLKVRNEASVNITKGLVGSNTIFGANTYSAKLTNCDVVASADAYYDDANKYVYATGPLRIVPNSQATLYPFWVFGSQVSSTNCGYLGGNYLKSGSVRFNASTNMFEMRNAQVDYNQEVGEPFIKAKDRALNLMLYGNNTVNCSAEAIVADGENLSVMGGECALTLNPASTAASAASVYLANGANMSVFATSPGFNFQRIADDGTGTLEVNCPMTVNGGGSDAAISVKKIEIGEDVELLTTLERPQSVSGGTVVDGSNKPVMGIVEFVPQGTSPTYATSIEIANPSITLDKRGATAQIEFEVLPADATNPTLTWTSSDYGVVSVGTKGTVKAVSNGTATITATTSNGIKGTATVTVAIPDPVSITLSEDSYWIKDESTGAFFLEATIENEDADQTITWTSSDENVVTVTPFGKECRVNRVADEGTAVVTAATVNGLEAACNVRIHYPVYAESIKLTENEVRFTEIGQEKTLNITVVPETVDADLLDFITDVRGGDAEVADVQVTSDGLVSITAKKEGTMGVAVWATCDGSPVTYDYVSITVRPIVLATGVTLTPPVGMEPKFYAFDEQMQLTAIVTPANSDNSELTWTSSDPSVATVDESGIVTSKGIGFTKIKATTTDGTNLSAELGIEVLDPADWAIVPANGVTLSRSELTLFPDQRFEMTAELAPQFANTYVDWEVEAVSGEDGEVEVTPGNWSDGYDAQPSESRWADVRAYVPNKAEATFPIVAKIKAKVRDYEGEEQPIDICTVTIVDDIYFTEANAEGIDITYHVINADPMYPECELYGKEVTKKVDGEWRTYTEPAIDGELTGKLIVPSEVNGYRVTTVGKGAFSRSNIEEVVLPEGLTTVAPNAFSPNIGFEKLQAVTLPSTLKYLGNSAFSGQNNLKQITINSIVLPEAIDDMGVTSGMLSDCFSGIADDAVLTVPYGCIELYSDVTWLQWFANIEDGSYLTQDTEESAAVSYHISSQGDMTAEVKGKPIDEMNFAKAVSEDYSGALNIDGYVNGYKVTSIAGDAFAELDGLTEVTLPESIEKIGNRAFWNCRNLKVVTINSTTPPVVESDDVFGYSEKNESRVLRVPNGCKEQYDTAPWNTWFDTIEELPAADYLPDTDINDIANVIYAASVKVAAGETATLSIRMKNEVSIGSFQFRLYLPDGTGLVKKGGKYVSTLNSERLGEDDEHSLSFIKQKDGSVMVLCGSPNDESFAEGDDEVISLPVNVAEGVASGEYPITLQQISLTELDISKSYETDVVKSTMTVTASEGVKKGDANGDGKVNAYDIVEIVNYIMGTPSEKFKMKGADVNGDKTVNIADVIAIVNMIE